MISLTERAVKEVKQMLEKEKRPGLALRVGVKGGGCAGMEYALSFDSAQQEWDEVFEVEGVKILVDAKSLLFLEGTTIDFSHSLTDSGFKFNNPNSKGSCGCGISFTV